MYVKTILKILLMMVRVLISDVAKYSTGVAILRFIRSSRVILMANEAVRIMNNNAYQMHVENIDKTDLFFFLSHKFYLIKGSSYKKRILSAVFHYEHELSFLKLMTLKDIYRDDGVVLWSKDVEGVSYEIKYIYGNDVLYEGAASIVLYYNKHRVCVLSFAFVPASLYLSTFECNALNLGDSQAIPLLTRKQLDSDHSYQKDFNKAFDRVMPAHLCLSALSAVANAYGYHHTMAISARLHPSESKEYKHIYENAYDKFWEDIPDCRFVDGLHLFSLPIQLKPIEELDTKARKRAMLRREHIEDVYQNSLESYQALLIRKND